MNILTCNSTDNLKLHQKRNEKENNLWQKQTL